MVSRYPRRYPDPQNDESPAEAELAKPYVCWDFLVSAPGLEPGTL